MATGGSEIVSAAIALDEVRCGYGRGPDVLRGTTLTVRAGEVVGLCGANGAGKSTLVRAVAGLLGPHNGRVRSGTVTVSGDDVHRLPPDAVRRLGVATVMEGRRLFGSLTVEENLFLGGYPASSRAARRSILDRSFATFPVLEPLSKVRAALLSGGEQQMLAIARALASDPAILLLDEPSLGLAPAMVKRVASSLNELRTQGMTILLVEQDVSLVSMVADRLVVLNQGRVEEPRGASGDVIGAADEVASVYFADLAVFDGLRQLRMSRR